jgi:uncharacterized membrane protein
LIAIGYDDEGTASAAARELRQNDQGAISEPDAVAVISRDTAGGYHVSASLHPVGAEATWGMFWSLLFGLLFFVPAFGVTAGPGLGALFANLETAGVDRRFQERVRGMVSPGTSALFVAIGTGTPDATVAAVGRFGGTVLASTLASAQGGDTVTP